MRTDSWQEPGTVSEGHYSEQWQEATYTMPGVTGCNLLSFEPGIEAQPDTPLADAPVGLGVNLRVPQAEDTRNARDPARSQRRRDTARGHVDFAGDR